MMRRVLLTCCITLMSVVLSAQDFTSLFLKECETDTTFTRVTISPKMMEEILQSDTDKDKDIMEIISSLKSMQMLSAGIEAEAYYQKALRLVEDNPKRFEPYLSYKDKDENYQIIVRKRRGAIIELIMLMVQDNRFAIINFTGKIKPEFISTLTGSMTRKHS